MEKTWKVEFDDRALKELRKLSKPIQTDIISYLKEKISTNQDPKRFGKPLVGQKFGLWRYRVSDYRIIARIDDSKVTILILRVAHRKEVYN